MLDLIDCFSVCVCVLNSHRRGFSSGFKVFPSKLFAAMQKQTESKRGKCEVSWIDTLKLNFSDRNWFDQ